MVPRNNNTWKNVTERPNVEGVSIRGSRDGAPSRKGCVWSVAAEWRRRAASEYGAPSRKEGVVNIKMINK